MSSKVELSNADHVVALNGLAVGFGYKGDLGAKKTGITYMTSKTLAGGFKWSRCKAGLCIFYRVFSETLWDAYSAIVELWSIPSSTIFVISLQFFSISPLFESLVVMPGA